MRSFLLISLSGGRAATAGIFAVVTFATVLASAATFRDPASTAPTTINWTTKTPSATDPVGVSVMCSTGDYSTISVSLQNRTNQPLCLTAANLISSMSDEKKDPTFDCRILPGNAHDLRQFSKVTGTAISGCGSTGLRVLAGDVYEAKFTFDPKTSASSGTSKKYEVAIPTSCDSRTAQVNKYDFECTGR